MTAVGTPAEILALLDSDLAAGILAAADLRGQRANAATAGPYVPRAYRAFGYEEYEIAAGERGAVWLYIGDGDQDRADAEHIAAEASPAYALAAVRRWRGVVERHREKPCCAPDSPRKQECHWPSDCESCTYDGWPCPDLVETADEVRAYLQGGY